jgi:hypothetical protein
VEDVILKPYTNLVACLRIKHCLIESILIGNA